MIKCNTMVQDKLFNWMFHYNPYTKKWNGFRREEYVNYFNGTGKDIVADEDYQNCIHKAFLKETEKDVQRS